MAEAPKFVISEELISKIASYLSGRPWGEVNNLMAGLSETVSRKGAAKIGPLGIPKGKTKERDGYVEPPKK